MHHAYPRECPFPHVTGAATRISPTEWMDTLDVDSVEASETEMTSFVRSEKDDPLSSDTLLEALPWTMEEELVAGHLSPPTLSSPPRTLKVLRFVLVAFLLASLAAPITHLARYVCA